MIFPIILSFFGLIAGIILAHYTKEELKTGKKYFIILYKFILFITIIYALFLSELNYYLFGAILGIILFIFLRNIYLYLGLLIFSTLNLYMFYLVFLFGLPYGSLIYSKKDLRNIVLNSFVWFVAAALILLIDINQTFLLSFSAGALFMAFLRRIH